MKKVIILILILGNFLYASIGKITALDGEVFAKQTNKDIKISLGYNFEKDDIIYTKNGKAQLTFKDNTVITLGKNSKLIVEEYVLSEKDIKKSKAKFRFAKGLFKTITGAIGKANHKNFKIRTKTATIGIRGTVFRVHVLTPPRLPGMNIPAPKLENSQTSVAVDQGSVSVTSNTGKEIVLNVGEAAKVDITGKVQPIPIEKVGKTGLKSDKKKEKPAKEENKKSKKEKQTKKDKETKQNKEKTDKKNDSSQSKEKQQEQKTSKKDNTPASEKESGEEKNQAQNSDEQSADNNKESEPATNESGQNTQDEPKTPLKEETVVGDSLESEPVVKEDKVPNINPAGGVLQPDAPVVDDTAKAVDDVVKDVVEVQTHGNENAPESPVSGGDMDLLTPQPPAGATQKTLYEDSYASMGYWENSDLSVDSTWIVGKSITDPDKIINNYMISEVTASYSGDVAALVSGKLAKGNINLDIDFGTQNVNGNMNFQVPNEAKWDVNINGQGSVFASGFSADLSTGANSEVQNITGTLNGNYFGDNAQAVGGTFDATGDGANVAKGVFEAVKTGAGE